MAVNKPGKFLNAKDAEMVEMVDRVRDYSRFFEVKIEIRVFGRLVWSIVWPPKKGGLDV